MPPHHHRVAGAPQVEHGAIRLGDPREEPEADVTSPQIGVATRSARRGLGRASRAEPEPGYFFVFGQPVTVVRPGPVGSAPGVQVPVRCHTGDFLKQIDQNA